MVDTISFNTSADPEATCTIKPVYTVLIQPTSDRDFRLGGTKL